MNWEILTDKQQFDSLMQNETLFAIFKHSTRCSISSMAKNRIEKEWNHQFPIYYLDLLQHRDVSNHIADVTNIEHQSPQLIVIKNGKPIYDASHNFIYVNDITTE
jgi:bacillithiol system protein YtxJ